MLPSRFRRPISAQSEVAIHYTKGPEANYLEAAVQLAANEVQILSFSLHTNPWLSTVPKNVAFQEFAKCFAYRILKFRIADLKFVRSSFSSEIEISISTLTNHSSSSGCLADLLCFAAHRQANGGADVAADPLNAGTASFFEALASCLTQRTRL